MSPRPAFPMVTGEPYRRLERLALNAWPALRQVECDGWIARFADGYTKRANSVTALHPGTLDLGDKIACCEALYREQALPILFRLTPFSEPWNLDATLEGRGYAVLDPTLVLQRSLERPVPAPGPGVLRLHDLEAWHALYCSIGGLAPDDRHLRILRRVTSSTLPATWQVGGTPVSCALGVLEDGFVGIFDLLTHTSHRRRGYGRSLIAALLREARRLGATRAYLQVVEANDTARALYAEIGFEPIYGYWYRVGPCGRADRGKHGGPGRRTSGGGAPG